MNAIKYIVFGKVANFRGYQGVRLDFALADTSSYRPALILSMQSTVKPSRRFLIFKCGVV